MKKFELILLCLFVFVSIGFTFVMPDSVLNNIEEEIHFILYVEGLIETEFVLDYIPSVKNILDLLEIENIYGFNDERKLEHRQVLYIPIDIKNKISLNHATLTQLESISGIGPNTANKIIQYRKTKSFDIIEDIQKISGIGYKSYLNIRAYLCP